MPFPLAHPAAVLPLQRFCPRQLNFPALVIGSLVPDLGYAFLTPEFGQALAHPNSDNYTHQFWPGSFMLCLPAGLVVSTIFHLVWRSALSLLPTPHQQALRPRGEGPVKTILRLVVSLLLGTWTHLILDSMTHENGWLVEHLAFLRSSWPGLVGHRMRVHNIFYYVSTFAGVAWLAWTYISWLEKASGPSGARMRGTKWLWAVLPATAVLVTASAGRGPGQMISMIPVGAISFLLVVGFLVASGRKKPS